MSTLRFREMVNLLAKSSPEAVSTLHRKPSPARTLKSYLYVETDIERDLITRLKAPPDPHRIIFLCGSSGDGKSEILSRVYTQYKETFDFHVDATHSFSPDKDAVDTLDELFQRHKDSQRPLVIGINIGMLGNYSARGSDAHADIKDSIVAFLSRNREPTPHHIFLNFEDYPKFIMDADRARAPFITELLDRITAASEQNPLYKAFTADTLESQLHANYLLLRLPEVRDKLIQVLLYVQLKFDQFMTARTILDFVHHLLTGPGYLFDNLFTGHNSDLCTALRHFDPCTTRSKQIDLFLIQHGAGITDVEFDVFKTALPQWIECKALTPVSWIRLFYLLQDCEIGNNFHWRFAADFRNEYFEQYLTIWTLHKHYPDSQEQKRRLRCFYTEQLIKALLSFANRFAPTLTDAGELILGRPRPNGYVLSTPADLRESLRAIAHRPPKRLGSFEACLKIGNTELRSVPISVTFFELILRIIRGYRPNKHDKNNIVLFEELIKEILRVARCTDRLHIRQGTHRWVLVNDKEDNEIRVEG